MRTRRRKLFKWLIALLVIAGVLTTVYVLRKEIVGQYVPEVTQFRSAEFRWVNDSLIGSVTMEIKNKSTSRINIDTISAGLQLDDVAFVDLKQSMDINLHALDRDTVSLYLRIPIQKFLSFLDSIVDKDSVAMNYSLTISYNTKVGHITLPINQTINIPSPRKILSQVVKFDYKEYKDKTAYADLYLSIYNPGRINVNLTDVHYTFTTTGDISSEGRYKKDVAIEPGEETRVVIPVEVEVDKPLKTVTNVIGNNDTYNFNVTLTGRLRTSDDVFDGCHITFRKSGSIELYDKDRQKKPEKEKKEKKSEKGFFRKKKT